MLFLSTRLERFSSRHDRRLGLSERVHKLRIQIKVHFDKVGRCQRQPLVERYVSIVRALEDLQKAQGRRARIFHIVPHRERDEADVPAAEIEGTRLAVGREHPHAPLAAYVVLPFVGVRMPVQLAQAAGLDLDKRGRDVLGSGEYARIGDPPRPAFGSNRLLRKHTIAEPLWNGFRAHELVGPERAWNRRFEDVELTRVWRMSEQRRWHAEILAQ